MLHTPRAILREFLTVYWRKIFSQLSSTRARTNRVADKGLRLLLTLVLLNAGIPGWAEEAVIQKTVVFNIPQQRADAALTEFAEQADLTLMFPPELVEDISTNELIGRYTPKEGAEILLAGTGLIPTFSNHVVLSISTDEQSALKGKAVNSKKKTGLVAIVTAALAAGVNAEEIDSPVESVSGTGVITGKVTDARTGANLKGALITIEETGQKTSSDNLGGFRLPNMSPGIYTLRASYLGFADGLISLRVVPNQAIRQEIQLEGLLEEVVVYGQRSERALALNQERTADNTSTVISADLLGSLEGTTISEVLRKVPGVAFVENPTTGDGANIIVRGVDPDLNAVRLNGIELPEASGTGRSADLGNILAESIDSVTISKTLLPSQDTSGTGGLVEIETKSPLDRNGRFVSLFAETSFSDENLATETQLSGVVSGVFGPRNNVGLSASVQYRTTERENFGYGILVYDGAWLPLQVDGSPTITSITDVNPNLGFPFEEGADQYYISDTFNSRNIVESENLGISLTGAWEPNDSTSLRFDYQLFEQETTTTSANSVLSSFGSYFPQPIQALGGEERAAILDFDFLDFQQTIIWVPDNKTETQVFSVRGETVLDRFQFDYSAGYTVGETPRTERNTLVSGGAIFGSADFLTDDAIDAVEGRIITPFGPRTTDGFVNLPLNEAGQQFFADPNSYTLRSVQNSVQTGENSRFDVGFSTRYEINAGPWRYFEAGLQFERSEFSSTTLSRSFASPFVPISDFDLVLTDTSFGAVGVEQSLPFYDLGVGVAFLGGAFNGGLGDVPIIDTIVDELTRQVLTTEDELAYYFETKFQFGDFDIVAGVRFSDYTVTADTGAGTAVSDEDDIPLFELNDQLRFLAEQKADQFEVLPRFQLNYRPSENFVTRFGYFKSAARPLVENINDGQSIQLSLNPRFGPNSNLPRLSVLSGNPTLEPPSTDSFDLSVEYYFSNVGVIKGGIFYKSIDNFIQNVVASASVGAAEISDFIQLPDNEEFLALIPDELFIEETIPTNSDEAAEIWGLELVVERQLTELSDVWNGLGVFANYTYTDSSRTTLAQWAASPIFDDDGNLIGTEPVTLEIDDVRFNQQPEHSGTVGLTYNKYGFDGILSYTYQDRRQTTFRPNDLSLFSEAIDSLDLRVEFRPTADRRSWAFFIEGTDLLDAASDPSFESSRGGINGSPKIITDASFFGGRELQFGVRKTF